MIRVLGSHGDEGIYFTFLSHEDEEEKAGKETSLLRRETLIKLVKLLSSKE